MSYLLDTMVISELSKDAATPPVLRFLRALDADESYISVITIGEIADGINRLPAGRKRMFLEQWFSQTLDAYVGRIIEVNQLIVTRWGTMSATVHRNGGKLEVTDGLIAATAVEHGLTVVTRNVGDFAPTGVDIVNPWDEGT